MKRRKPLQRFKGLTRSTAPRKITDKTAAKRRQYKPLREEFLHNNPECKMNFEGCTFVATQVHHSKGRGDYYLEVSTWIPACAHCHDIADNKEPLLAKGKGISFSKLSKNTTMNVNDFVGIDHGTGEMDLKAITKGRLAVELRPIELHHKADGHVNKTPAFSFVMTSIPEGTIVYGQVSLDQLTKALNTIGYSIIKKSEPIKNNEAIKESAG